MSKLSSCRRLRCLIAHACYSLPLQAAASTYRHCVRGVHDLVDDAVLHRLVRGEVPADAREAIAKSAQTGRQQGMAYAETAKLTCSWRHLHLHAPTALTAVFCHSLPAHSKKQKLQPPRHCSASPVAAHVLANLLLVAAREPRHEVNVRLQAGKRAGSTNSRSSRAVRP